MKDKNIKKVFDQIQVDESMKARMLENIYKKANTEINYKSNNKVIQFKYKKSVAILAVSILLVCGVLLNNNELPLDKDRVDKLGTQLTNEELAVKGKIDRIEVSENGLIIVVGDIKILVHVSTNIFKDELLLNVEDLKEGQSVEVYYDGVQNDVLNGLRIEILN